MKRFFPLGALATILVLGGCSQGHSLPAVAPANPAGAARVVLDTVGGSPPLTRRDVGYATPIQGPAQVKGRVIDSRGAPVRGATVVAYDERNDAVNSTATGADGSFTLRALRAGNYRIVVRNASVTESGDAVVASGATRSNGPSVDIVLPPSGVLDVGTLID